MDPQRLPSTYSDLHWTELLQGTQLSSCEEKKASYTRLKHLEDGVHRYGGDLGNEAMA